LTSEAVKWIQIAGGSADSPRHGFQRSRNDEGDISM